MFRLCFDLKKNINYQQSNLSMFSKTASPGGCQTAGSAGPELGRCERKACQPSEPCPGITTLLPGKGPSMPTRTRATRAPAGSGNHQEAFRAIFPLSSQNCFLCVDTSECKGHFYIPSVTCFVTGFTCPQENMAQNRTVSQCMPHT
jgi:hypothetical protein